MPNNEEREAIVVPLDVPWKKLASTMIALEVPQSLSTDSEKENLLGEAAEAYIGVAAEEEVDPSVVDVLIEGMEENVGRRFEVGWFLSPNPTPERRTYTPSPRKPTYTCMQEGCIV